MGRHGGSEFLRWRRESPGELLILRGGGRIFNVGAVE
jgi:hypothetical protein